ncbi:DUF2180 family protein [Streptomyces sp. NPDC059398]|uniref:DUF2180 family protein n=1 Tax=Streptomyces sp. NPDC059398 TaxID=3346820 RepID=UPI003699AF5D
MKCYDCHTSGRITPAIALCRSCGAGACADHSSVVPQTLHRINGMGVATLPRTARRILCEVCSAAEHSA